MERGCDRLHTPLRQPAFRSIRRGGSRADGGSFGEDAMGAVGGLCFITMTVIVKAMIRVNEVESEV